MQRLRPALRKDEESARTIVQSRFSTRPPSLSTFSRQSVTRMEDLVEENIDHARRFSFEDDLYLGPVYKRLLHSRLSSRSRPDLEDDDDDGTRTLHAATNAVEEMSTATQDDTYSVTLTNNATDELADDSCEAASVLYYFSGTNGRTRTCADDLNGLAAILRSSPCSRLRSLPMSNVVRMQFNTDEQQLKCNNRLLEAVMNDDKCGVAQAIDAGANVNAELGTSAETSLQLCFSDLSPARHEVAALLLSYRQTHVERWLENGMSLVHYCLRWELTDLLRLLVLRSDIFTIPDRLGRGPLQALLEDAAASSFATQEPVHELSMLHDLQKTHSFDVDKPDKKGRTPLFVALENHMLDSARILRMLGANCNVSPSPSQVQGHPSPLSWAVSNNALAMVEFLLFENDHTLPADFSDSTLGSELLTVAVSKRFVDVGRLLAKRGARLDRLRPLAIKMTDKNLAVILAQMQPFEVKAPKQLVKAASFWTGEEAVRTTFSLPFTKTASIRSRDSKLPFRWEDWGDVAKALSQLKLRLKVNLFCDGWRLTNVPVTQVFKFCFEMEKRNQATSSKLS